MENKKNGGGEEEEDEHALNDILPSRRLVE